MSEPIPEIAVQPEARRLRFPLDLKNRTGNPWPAGGPFCLGWQVFDPDTGLFLSEGEWQAAGHEVAPGASARFCLDIVLPPESGPYRVYVSGVSEALGWDYQRGLPFLLLDAVVEGGRASLRRARWTTTAALNQEALWRALGKAVALPFETLWTHRGLIRSLVRRDVLGRYRGSFGDVLWTLLNPLLLILTYFFVFGIVLQARFGADPSRAGFALYFLTGMLPWLAFSEAVGRAPHVIFEHRNLVKKVVFPVQILPVVQTMAGMVTEAFALVVFLVGLVAVRGAVPASAFWLPVLLAPQWLLTLGIAWGLAALGAFVRDLGQVMGFLLTLWFFLTPICYPEASLPPWALPVLGKNPMYVLVRGYRAIFLEARPPDWPALGKLYLLAAAAFFAGHALFHKLRKSFADVV